MQVVLEWFRENERLPIQHRHPTTESQTRERKAAKALVYFRGRASSGALKLKDRKLLDEAYPDWLADRQVGKTEEQALAEAEELRDWCKQHHGGKLVAKRFDKNICDDEPNHQRMWNILQYLQEARAGTRGGWFPGAFKVLDDAFGAEKWQRKSRNVKSEGAVVLGKRRTRSPTQRAGTEKRRSGRSSVARQQEEENGQQQVDMMEGEEGQPLDDEGRAQGTDRRKAQPGMAVCDMDDEEEEEEDEEEPEEGDDDDENEGQGQLVVGMEDCRLDEQPRARGPQQTKQRHSRRQQQQQHDEGRVEEEDEEEPDLEGVRGLLELRRAAGELGRDRARPPTVEAAVDPVRKQCMLEELRVRKKPVVCYGVNYGTDGELVGIERQGYGEGGVFVLSPSVDWRDLLSQPLGKGRQGRAAAGGALKDLQLRAEYKGYRRWRDEIQQGVFMILCLRGRRDELRPERVKAIKQELESGGLGRHIGQALGARQRRPIVEVQFPVVAGAHVDAVQEGAGKLVEGLRAVLGVDRRAKVWAAVQADEGVMVKPIQRATQTATRPFELRDVGDMNVERLAGEQGSRQEVVVRQRLGRRNPPNAPDVVLPLGNVEESIAEAAAVAMSFIRAHGDWIDQRFGFADDPRSHQRRDFLVGVANHSTCLRGYSIGAAFAATIASYFTEVEMPWQLSITGQATISGRMLPVSDYREKLLAVVRDAKTIKDTGVLLQVVVPAASVVNGVLVERLFRKLKATGAKDVAVRADCQVRLPTGALSGIRVLAAEDLFDLLELCLITDRPAVPRPVGLVPGLAVGKTLVLSSDVMGCVQLVEVFIYPGKGHVLCTAPNDACKRMAELGVFFVKNDWGLVCERYPEIEPRKNPLDGDYDLHVNIPLEQAAPWSAGELAFAVVGAFYSLLLGKRLPESLAFSASMDLNGVLRSPDVKKASLATARTHGITTVICAAYAEPTVEGFLSSCSADDRGELSPVYMRIAKEVWPLLWGQPEDLPDLPPDMMQGQD